MTVDQLEHALQVVPLLRDLPDDAVRVLAAGAEVRSVPARTTLLHAGDPADGMYIILSGRLDVLDETGQSLRRLGAGATVGEVALLTGAPRSASVIAVRDSHLAFVAQSQFLALLSARPDLALLLAASLARQLATSGSHLQPRAGVTCLLTWTAAGDVVATDLAAARAASGTLAGNGSEAKWCGMVDAAEKQHRNVTLLCSSVDTAAWRAFCLRTADRTVALGADAPPWAIDDVAAVAVVAEPQTPWPAWAQLWPAVLRARVGSSADVQRLARRLDGRAPGVVLSGGGARGLAHIGVLAELEGQGCRADSWGGCSMGAFIAALAATGRDAASIEDVCRQELVQRRPFRDYALVPRHGFLRAQRAREMLERTFGSQRIEDLAEPFFCVSADLVSGDLVVHREGLVSTAVGASMCIPGLAPPVRDGHRWLVDGGVLDNLPVDVLRAQHEGPVVAVDVMRNGLPADAAAPTLMETIGQALTIAGRRRIAQNRADADLVITPLLGAMRLFDFAMMPAAVDAGREAARSMTERAAALWGESRG